MFGFIEIVVGLLMLIVPFVDLLTRSVLSIHFLYTSLLLIVVGMLLSRIEAPPLGLIEGVVATSLLWVLITLESAIPFMLSLNIGFIDAWFESISGFTGTGFTVLSGLDDMKPSIVCWRSVMQWTGELGVVVFAMILFPYFHRLGSRAYGVERPLKIEASFYRTAMRLFNIYLVLTVVGLILYVYTGMNFYEAFNHVLTTVATGGMSTYDEGYQKIFVKAPYTYIPMIILMFISGMNFILLDRVIRGDLRSVWRSEEFRTYLATAFILVSLTTISYILLENYDPYTGFLYGAFNQISGISTTGFNLGSLSKLKPLTKIILTIGMFIGAMAFSTGGGIKIYRLVIILKKLKYTALSMLSIGRFEKTIQVDGVLIDESEVASTILFPLIHASAIFIGASLMTLAGYDLVDTLFEATSASSCVGLSVGIVSQQSPLLVKSIIMVLMILGRLEYVQIISLMGYLSGRRILKVLK